jgi:hypothetical protein
MARTAVIAGTATAVAGGVHHRQEQRYAKQAEDQYAKELGQQQMAAQAAAAAAPPPPPPAAASGDDKIAKLTKLGELKTAGILTEEEFAAEKAKILAS